MATRDDLLSAPRSGARPLFRGEPAPARPAPSTSRARPAEPAPAPAPTPRSASNGTGAGTTGRPRGSEASEGRTEPRSRRGSRLRTAQGIGRAATSTPDFKNYQGIILVEFILAELFVAGTPMVARKPATDTSISPYAAHDMVKLLSIGLVYFLLELMALGGAKAGRLGAWFGGLILLGVVTNESVNVAKVLNPFGGGATQSPLQSDVQSGQIGVT